MNIDSIRRNQKMFLFILITKYLISQRDDRNIQWRNVKLKAEIEGHLAKEITIGFYGDLH